ncbi:hypothetical protein ANACOL_04041 [Anaerotruncus colihominis DSM 17241]|uniref:Uncharacterized protein n=1 Tax=Anaerotruncus colihominis DSM 17241 TaxID=445972 RepID=B0PH20_9FIRM|nr:hypothetical protein ANACOL_04041 [Anaerotruncus colihominis DSM 17241]
MAAAAPRGRSNGPADMKKLRRGLSNRRKMLAFCARVCYTDVMVRIETIVKE